MDLEYLYGDVTFELDPLDFRTLKKNPAVFDISATEVKTGKAVYFQKDAPNKTLAKYLMASSTIPLIGQKPIKHKNMLLLDGGLADPIPFQRAVDKGYKKIVVVHTQQKGYVKEPSFSARLLSIQYGKYKEFCKLVQDRHNIYNKQIKQIMNPPKGVEVFTFYPSKKPYIKRLEKDKDLLEKQWKMGYKDCKKLEKKLLRFLNRT